MNIDVLFFERTLADLKKFAFKISKEIKQLDSNVSIGAVAVEMPEPGLENSIDYFISRKKISDIDRFLKENDVKIMVFTQTRIPDMEFILHCKKLGIKTIMLQEGIMFDGMNINDVSVKNAFAILGYIPKVMEYFGIVWDMCRYDNKSFFKVWADVLREKKNVTLKLAKEFSIHLIGDYIFTMGAYWDDYYLTKHGYSPNQIRIIGDHDLDGFERSGINEPAICYVANVLVEDGTVPRKDFDEFISTLADIIPKNIKLYIKLHPRSDKSLYDAFSSHNVVFIREGKLPSTTIYLGHRSALLGRALYESDNLIIWRFACEEVCFYERFATATCTTATELKNAFNAIDISSSSNKKLEEITKVYWNNPEGSMRCAAGLIYNYMYGKKI